MPTRILALMGSGETTPTMTSTHRLLLERLDNQRAVMLDTPFGFQENADQIVDKTCEYFAQSVGRPLGLASFRSAERATRLGLETALTRIREAGYIFAGPGSPSYALRQWKGSPIADLLLERLRGESVLVFASAAACTLGSHCIPVYEIYKVGQDPFWLEGLNLLEALGLPVVVVPHFNNGEGGTHDTRFCYLGARRLEMLEPLLPKGTSILGVDEHTACLLDLEQRTASVAGRGTVTVRQAGRMRVYPAGSQLSFEQLLADKGGTVASEPAKKKANNARAADTPFGVQMGELEARFAQALSQSRSDQAVAAILGLEQAIEDWSADTATYQGDRERARSMLRSMVVRLGEAAQEGLRDPAERVAPIVERILEARTRARGERQWLLADAMRDLLVGAGVEVHDTPEGTRWELRAHATQHDRSLRPEIAVE